MANEITISATLRVANGTLKKTNAPDTLQIDMAGTKYSGLSQEIGYAAHEAVSISAEVGTEGFAFLQNHDDTNYVEVGVDVSATFYPLIRLKPGEYALLRLSPGVTVYAQANTAAVELEHFVLED